MATATIAADLPELSVHVDGVESARLQLAVQPVCQTSVTVSGVPSSISDLWSCHLRRLTSRLNLF